MGKSNIVGIDIFSGAEGMSLGTELAGISVICAIEKDIYAADTYKTNHPNTEVINKDIREIEKIPKVTIRKEPIVLFGSAPCQGFSTSNRRTNNRDSKACVPNNYQ